MSATRDGDRILLDGIATAHSHAFQRALRGRTHRKKTSSETFWSWRELMYALATKLDPESIHAISKFAFAELARSGVTTVGEFHYVHHDPRGVPYADRNVLGREVLRAAREVGLRVVYLRVIYQRAGAGRPPEDGQKRFCDASIDHVLRDLEGLAAEFRGDPLVTFGIAPHSLRAVPIEVVLEAHAYATERGMPFHMHLSEQRREVEECLAEHGKRPVELLAERGVLDERFCGVHGTHVEPHEAALLGRARAFVCVCRTTERDLGDGFPDVSAYVANGVRICTGTDSHASSDPFEETRAIELDERARTETRCVALEGPALLDVLGANAYAALGLGGREKEDRVVLDARDPALVGTTTLLEDGIVFAAPPRAVVETRVAGRVLEIDLDEIAARFEGALAKLGLDRSTV